MTKDILFAVGGIGLFLLGMLVLTEGLRGLAGNAIRRLLARATTSPASGALAGAVTTAIIQSSSATTVTAVGFVGAGLLTFPQALGIVFGANIGTTVTGWMVAILGFKLKLSAIALPLVLLGVLLRLFAPGRWKHLGWALAGFSLLFIGIDTVQQGMAGFKGMVTPESFPPDTLIGRLQLVGIGIAITLVTQSSSAGVAMALMALAAGAITLPQAAAMVIGMDVGTTFKAALATIGGSAAMRQTGFAHVIYNLATGTIGFALLTPWIVFVAPLVGNGAAGDPQVTLVAFHTAFNIIGVAVILPFARPFAHLVMTLFRDEGTRLSAMLDDRLLAEPRAAIDAATAALRAVAGASLRRLAMELDAREAPAESPPDLDQIGRALDDCEDFIQRIPADEAWTDIRARRAATIHVLDHLMRLNHRMGQHRRLGILKKDRRLRRLGRILGGLSGRMAKLEDPAFAAARFEKLQAMLVRGYHAYRERSLREVPGEQEIDTLDRLDSARWLYRTAYHNWRLAHHLGQVERTSLIDAAEAAQIFAKGKRDEEPT